MGRVAETMTKKKKKGRPSLLEIQKRTLKEQQKLQLDPLAQSPPIDSKPNPNARSTRRNPILDAAPGSASDDDERSEKKHVLLRGLNSTDSSAPNSVPDRNADGENPEETLRKRRIGAESGGSGEMEKKVSKVKTTHAESLVESGPTTPLPDKKLLVFILDRLQKKDTYGVFSEPVDPEELPDYHDIVEHPMDFGTVRRKLDEGAYASLEQFEKDVFLICSNAMEYNAPDTVFFRQARSMQELAKKDFDNLRQESDDSEPQPKVARRGRPPGKSLKKLQGRSPPSERVGPEFSSDATLATGGDNGSWSNTYNLRKLHTPDKFQVADASVRVTQGSHNSDSYSSWLSEWENEFPASVLKAVLKYGKKPFTVDENRRESYKLSLNSGHEPSVLNTLEGEPKQLMAVGVQIEHGYSRSLARFAADLGPHVWKIASKKIESVLPSEVKFGPGWVGECDVLVGPQFVSSGKQKPASHSVLDDHISRLLPPNTSGSNSISDRSLPNAEDTVDQNKLISLNRTLDGGIRPVPHPMQQDPVISHGMNGYSGVFMNSFPQQIGMARAGTATGYHSLDEASVASRMLQGVASTDNTGMSSLPANKFASPEPPRLPESLQSRFPMKTLGPPEGGLFGKSPWQGMSVSPDLNMRSSEPGLPSAKLRIGSPQHPDLALQL